MDSLGPPPDWADVADVQLPSDHPIVARLGRPGEVFWPELGVVDWRVYLSTIDDIRRLRAIRSASLKVLLSNRRMIVLKVARRHVEYDSVPLRDILRVEVQTPEGVEPGSGESLIHVESRTDVAVRTDDWSIRTRDAFAFARKLEDLMTLVREGESLDEVASRGRLRLKDL